MCNLYYGIGQSTKIALSNITYTMPINENIFYVYFFSKLFIVIFLSKNIFIRIDDFVFKFTK